MFLLENNISNTYHFWYSQSPRAFRRREQPFFILFGRQENGGYCFYLYNPLMEAETTAILACCTLSPTVAIGHGDTRLSYYAAGRPTVHSPSNNLHSYQHAFPTLFLLLFSSNFHLKMYGRRYMTQTDWVQCNTFLISCKCVMYWELNMFLLAQVKNIW